MKTYAFPVVLASTLCLSACSGGSPSSAPSSNQAIEFGSSVLSPYKMGFYEGRDNAGPLTLRLAVVPGNDVTQYALFQDSEGLLVNCSVDVAFWDHSQVQFKDCLTNWVGEGVAPPSANTYTVTPAQKNSGFTFTGDNGFSATVSPRADNALQGEYHDTAPSGASGRASVTASDKSGVTLSLFDNDNLIFNGVAPWVDGVSLAATFKTVNGCPLLFSAPAMFSSSNSPGTFSIEAADASQCIPLAIEGNYGL